MTIGGSRWDSLPTNNESRITSYNRRKPSTNRNVYVKDSRHGSRKSNVNHEGGNHQTNKITTTTRNFSINELSFKAKKTVRLEDSIRQLQLTVIQQQDVESGSSENHSSISSLKSALSNNIEQMMTLVHKHSEAHSSLDRDIIIDSLYWMLRSINHLGGAMITDTILLSGNSQSDKGDDVLIKVLEVSTEALSQNTCGSQETITSAKKLFTRTSNTEKPTQGTSKESSTVLTTKTDIRVHDCVYQMLEYTRTLMLKQSSLFRQQTEVIDASTTTLSKEILMLELRLELLWKLIEVIIQIFGFEFQRQAEVFINSLMQSFVPDTVIPSKITNPAYYKCLSTVLKWKHLASAMLEPLVIDVSVDNEEEIFKTNHNKLILLNFLEQTILYVSVDYEGVIEAACNCCQQVLTLMPRHKSKHPSYSNKEKSENNQVGNILKRLEEILQHTTSKSSSTLLSNVLKLFIEIVQTYPQTIIQHWHYFLQPSFKHQSNHVNFITILSSSDYNIRIKRLVLEALNLMIKALPLRLWFSSTSTVHWRQTPDSNNASKVMGHLEIRAKNAIRTLIYCIDIQISKVDTSNDNNDCLTSTDHEAQKSFFHSLCILVITILTFTPFPNISNHNEMDLLIDPAIHLFNSVSEIFEQSIDKLIHTRNNHIETLTYILKNTSNVLAQSVGGDETPQGTTTPTPTPIQIWLESEKSNQFFNKIFPLTLNLLKDRKTIGKDNNSLIIDALLNVFHRMIRSSTHRVLCKSSNIKNNDCFFEILLQALDHDQTISIQCKSLNILQAFVLRNLASKQSVQEDEKFKMTNEQLRKYNEALEKLPSLIHQGTNVSLILQTLSTYGSLQGSDWVLLMNDSSKNDTAISIHFSNILNLCIPSSRKCENKSIRSEACKTIGNIFSSCINSNLSLDIICEMIQKGVQILLMCTKESTSTVKSMALFALGNIAVALKQNEGNDLELYRSFPVEILCKSMLIHLNDTNDKVVGNAIRTTGHLFYILSHSNHGCYCIDLMGDVHMRIIENMTMKIEMALSDANAIIRQRSWKQRSSTKKHAWGACRCLSSVLAINQCFRDSDLSRQICRRSLTSLINCILFAHNLNEKISIAAVSTLNLIPKQTWNDSSTKDESTIGECISACLVYLHKVSKGATKITETIYNSVNTLMKKMLSDSTEKDIHVCLFKTDLSHEIVEFLYGWMVNQRIESRSFELVSNPLQHESVPQIYSVSLAQKFRSRAAKEQREEISGNSQLKNIYKNKTYLEINDTNIVEDEDEL